VLGVLPFPILAAYGGEVEGKKWVLRIFVRQARQYFSVCLPLSSHSSHSSHCAIEKMFGLDSAKMYKNTGACCDLYNDNRKISRL
jgi:hypothetical protein